jgi:DNA-binding HxlR family transcriptional regulator
LDNQLTLSDELRKLVEARLEQTLRGIKDTLNQILEKQEITPKELKEELANLEENCNLLFQKWSLEILYTLFLKKIVGFGELKKILGVNSRTLSDKLKTLTKHNYVNRNVSTGPPLRVEYDLTRKGNNTILLALPLLYYSSSTKTRVK